MLGGWLDKAGLGKGRKAKTEEAKPRWVDKQIEPAAFERIRACGKVVVRWSKGQPSCVARVDLDDPASDGLSVSWEGGVAQVRADPSAKSPARVSLSSWSLSGFECEGEAAGSAEGVEAEVFEARVQDGAPLELSGRVVAAKLSVSGSGKLLADRLRAHAVYAAVRSTGVLEANAESIAEVEISGGGEALVYGNPRVSKVDRRGDGRAKIGSKEQSSNEGEESLFDHLPVQKF